MRPAGQTIQAARALVVREDRLHLWNLFFSTGRYDSPPRATHDAGSAGAGMSETSDPVAESRPHMYLIGLLLFGAVLFSVAAAAGLALGKQMSDPGNSSNPASSSRPAND